MPVPKKKTSRSVRDQRRSHDAIKYVSAVEYCPSCGEPKLRHHACAKCGQYRGRAIGPNTIAAPDATPVDGGESAPEA